jgi:uncharacterized protein YjbK
LSQSNRPLNSKELKIILKSDKFTEVATYKENIINLIKSQIQKQGGTFDDTTQEEDHRKVWYLDTKNFELNNNNFLLRIREKLKNNEEEKVKGYDVVLKIEMTVDIMH